jgi:hypothetical protein
MKMKAALPTCKGWDIQYVRYKPRVICKKEILPKGRISIFRRLFLGWGLSNRTPVGFHGIEEQVFKGHGS